MPQPPTERAPSPAVEHNVLEHRHDEATTAGMRVGPYRLLDEIGRGGMAVIYRAERVEGGFEQQVAIKLVQRGTDTEEILLRFVQERQILASLEHPAIARLLDGGATEDGRPYLVMELVEGRPIDRYCAENGLELEAKLRLFGEVCRAVEHAHRRLVVHRDLKPSNVLITDDGQVKLLDFGIAKLLEPDPRGGAAPATRSQARRLTPEYASPEQIRGESVTTATDVYQLGLLLYELLTGQRPFAAAERSPLRVAEAICHQPPTAPSSAMAQTGETGTARSRRRLARRLRGDLDNVVLMALRKEPERRYPGARALAEDVERFLSDRPVSARPTSLVYRAGKFARRHTWGLATAAAAVVLLGAFASYHSLRLARERDRAQREATKAQRVSEFLAGVLGTGESFQAPGAPLSPRALLDQGAARIDAELSGEPELAATLLAEIGQIYRRQGFHDEARRRLEQSLALRKQLFGDKSLQVAESQHLLGALFIQLSQLRASRELLEAALETRRELLGPKHPAVGKTLVAVASVHRAFGEHERTRAELDEGLAILEAAFGAEHLEVAQALLLQANHLAQLEEHARTAEVLTRALRIREQHLGPGSVPVAEVLIELGALYQKTGRLEDSRRVLERAVAIHETHFSPDHPALAFNLSILSVTLRELGDLEAAQAAQERALTIARRVFGAESPRTLSCEKTLIGTLQAAKKHREALPLAEHFLSAMERLLGPEHPHLLEPLLRHAQISLALGERPAALASAERVLALTRKDTNGIEPMILEQLMELATTLGLPAPTGAPSSG